VNNTKERPIILTAQEANAVLAGDKTQHRVVIENTKDTQCLFSGDWRYDGRDFLDDGDCTPDPKGAHYVERLEPSEGEERQYTEDYRCVGHCPLGKVGDRLWVQEPTHTANSWDWFYDATHSLVECKDPYTPSDLYLPWDDDHQEYTGPIAAEHMPYWASRLLLEVTDIRIERIKDISEADAKAMGLKPDYCDHKYQTCEDIGCIGIWASALFLHLRHEKKLAVHYTDWVWVIEFKVVEPSEENNHGHN
tara:strand:- start:23 stop:769 length:747 start_codon:yes stop_codon:yes gene_type:complete